MNTLSISMIAATATLGLAMPGSASDMTYVDPCIDAISKANGPDAPKGGLVLSQEFSEAGTLVMLEDGSGQTWRCISYKDGAVGELTKVDAPDDGGGAMAGAPKQNDPTETTQRVQFAKGTSGAIIDVSMGSGDAVNYLLGARDGQFLDVKMDTDNPYLYFMIYVPDGGILYESAQAGNSYRGQLYQTGDHRVQVFYNGDVGTTASARMTFGIE